MPASLDSSANDRTSSDLPPLAEFLRWVVEMPEVFRCVPVGFSGGTVPVHSVVADLLDTLLGDVPDQSLLAAFKSTGTSKAERNRLSWVLAACHLLWHPALRARPHSAASLRKFLVQELATLASVAPADRLADEEDRREELIRRTLRALGLRLPGETQKEAEDRLAQVDSVEHRRLLKEAAEKERRAREVREAMARRAAEEAAAKVSRE